MSGLIQGTDIYLSHKKKNNNNSSQTQCHQKVVLFFSL